MGSLVTIILIVCIVYAVKGNNRKQQGKQARPMQNTYQRPPQARPVQNAYQQPPQARPVQNAYQQPPQARPAPNAYRQPPQAHPVQNAYQQPPQAHPVQNASQKPYREQPAASREQAVEQPLEIRLEEGITYLPETVLDAPSELMSQLQDLMVMGYQAKLPYERDFLAESMTMLTSAASNE